VQKRRKKKDQLTKGRLDVFCVRGHDLGLEFAVVFYVVQSIWTVAITVMQVRVSTKPSYAGEKQTHRKQQGFPPWDGMGPPKMIVGRIPVDCTIFFMSLVIVTLRESILLQALMSCDAWKQNAILTYPGSSIFPISREGPSRSVRARSPSSEIFPPRLSPLDSHYHTTPE
jgi:hypothetical protein